MRTRPPVKKRARYSLRRSEREPDNSFERDELSDDDDAINLDDTAARRGGHSCSESSDGSLDGDGESRDDEEFDDDAEGELGGCDDENVIREARESPGNQKHVDERAVGRTTGSEHSQGIPPDSAKSGVTLDQREGIETHGESLHFERDEVLTSSEDEDFSKHLRSHESGSRKIAPDDRSGKDAGAEEDDGADDGEEFYCDDDEEEGGGSSAEESHEDNEADVPHGGCGTPSGQHPKRPENDENDGDGEEDYATFLAAILAEDVPPAAALPEPFSSLLDDDGDDFDYLSAVALHGEDPFEFRNDPAVTVSRKEIVNLVTDNRTRSKRSRSRAGTAGVSFSAEGSPIALGSAVSPPRSTLAPQPRDLGGGSAGHFSMRLGSPNAPAICVTSGENPHANVLDTSSGGGAQQGGVPDHPALNGYPVSALSSAPVFPGAVGSSVPGPASKPAVPVASVIAPNPHVSQAALPIAPAGYVAPAAPESHWTYSGPQALPYRFPQAGSDAGWANCIVKLRRQMSTHVHLLGHVHCRAAANGMSSAQEKSASLLKELVNFRDLSRKYLNAFHPLREMCEGLPSEACHEVRSPAPETQFATPALNEVGPLLEAVAGGTENIRVTLGRLQPFADPSIASILTPDTPVKKLSKVAQTSAAKELPWTPEDDELLAMTIAKHSIEFGDNSKDLLPHRDSGDCEKRMRHLSSRRCDNNLVKAQVHAMTVSVQPLSVSEIDLVKQGIARFGDTSHKSVKQSPHVWYLIQREFLPHRDRHQLARMWEERELKNQYKKNLYAKRKARKAALGGKTAESAERGNGKATDKATDKE